MRMADAAARQRRVDRDGADLAEIGPQHMQRAATDHDAVVLGHPELLDGLIQRHEVLFQQDLARVGVDEVLDRRDVGGSRAPDREPLAGGSLAAFTNCRVSVRAARRRCSGRTPSRAAARGTRGATWSG